MFKRIILFALTNILILVTISIVLNVLGVGHYITANGIDYTQLMIFCLVWGMGGAFISLAISRIMAKWMMGVKVIDPQKSGENMWLLQSVHQLARNAHISVMPEVGIYESPEVNAFATGPTKNRSLVAVSSGLLRSMDKKQVEGVLGHEIAHIANGDMVTMTLIQGVVNAFVMFLARVIAFAVSQNVKAENRRMVQMFVVIGLEILLSCLGLMIVAWFSRQREFRADAGGAKYAGRGNMAAALEGLKKMYSPDIAAEETQRAPALATMKIAGKSKGWMHLFATHPPLDERIRRLQSAA